MQKIITVSLMLLAVSMGVLGWVAVGNTLHAGLAGKCVKSPLVMEVREGDGGLEHA